MYSERSRKSFVSLVTVLVVALSMMGCAVTAGQLARSALVTAGRGAARGTATRVGLTRGTAILSKSIVSIGPSLFSVDASNLLGIVAALAKGGGIPAGTSARVYSSDGQQQLKVEAHGQSQYLISTPSGPVAYAIVQVQHPDVVWYYDYDSRQLIGYGQISANRVDYYATMGAGGALAYSIITGYRMSHFWPDGEVMGETYLRNPVLLGWFGASQGEGEPTSQQIRRAQMGIAVALAKEGHCPAGTSAGVYSSDGELQLNKVAAHNQWLCLISNRSGPVAYAKVLRDSTVEFYDYQSAQMVGWSRVRNAEPVKHYIDVGGRDMFAGQSVIKNDRVSHFDEVGRPIGETYLRNHVRK